MNHLRKFVLLGILLAGGSLIALLVVKELNTPLGRTFAPLFALMGRPTKTADRLFSRVLPVEDIDEKTLGEGFKERFRSYSSADKKQVEYLNQLVKEITATGARPFEYEVFVESGPANAYALPGGVIVVYSGLLDILTSEAQLVAVLGHEVGHIERGHCFDSVRFQMVANKLHGRVFGEIVDILYGIATRHQFSKNQEQEADEYGFQKLLAMNYQGTEFSAAFQKMSDAEGDHEGGNILSDYFASHPPTALRIENYRERAKRLNAKAAGVKRYVGTRNYKELTPRSKKTYPEESL